MKKKVFLVFVMFLVLLTTGCNKDKKKDDVSRQEESKNKLICTSDNIKYILYFDDNNQLETFDAYDTIDLSGRNVSQKEVQAQANEFCEGKGEFPKEWMDECELISEGDLHTIHVYINNNKWFGDSTSKDEILELAQTDGFDGMEVTCK